MLNTYNLNQIKNALKGKTLIAVTKYVSVTDIKDLLSEGVYDIGENRVGVFLDKYEKINNKEIRWHFIGHLQSKKVKKVINFIDYLHALDRLSLADEIEKRRKEPLKCFIEVNISGESSKYGLAKENVLDFYHKMKEYDKIHVIGLMGMAKHTDNHEEIRRNFQVLLDLRDAIKASDNQEMYLSMGMSNDYQIALDMGSDFLRIGSFLFEEDK